VVDADAVAEDFREFAAVGGAEIGVVEGAGDGDGVFFLLGAAVGGEQVAGGVGAGVLGEVDEVNGRATLFVSSATLSWNWVVEYSNSSGA